MWKTIKVVSVLKKSFKGKDEDGNAVNLPMYPGLEDIAPGTKLHIFVAKDKDGLIRKVVGSLINDSR
jgi:hypothetical protein